LEYLVIEEARILDADGETIDSIENPVPLAPASLWSY
jgi:hypothetical protein